jgi:hypothetical protein
MAARTEKALNFAFARHERDTDTVLKELFRLERHRIDELLQWWHLPRQASVWSSG